MAMHRDWLMPHLPEVQRYPGRAVARRHLLRGFDRLLRSWSAQRLHYGKGIPAVRDAAEDFLEYLRQFPRNTEDEKSYLFQMLLPKHKSLARYYAERCSKRVSPELANRRTQSKRF
jgi:hypothetical protein